MTVHRMGHSSRDDPLDVPGCSIAGIPCHTSTRGIVQEIETLALSQYRGSLSFFCEKSWLILNTYKRLAQTFSTTNTATKVKRTRLTNSLVGNAEPVGDCPRVSSASMTTVRGRNRTLSVFNRWSRGPHLW